MRLRLYVRHRCSDGVRIYSRVRGRVHYRYPQYHRIYKFRYRIFCNGNTTSGGGG
jgi:hypothetical protein